MDELALGDSQTPSENGLALHPMSSVTASNATPLRRKLALSPTNRVPLLGSHPNSKRSLTDENWSSKSSLDILLAPARSQTRKRTLDRHFGLASNASKWTLHSSMEWFSRLQYSLDGATLRRQAVLNQRQSRLRHRFDQDRQRMQLHAQKSYLHRLRLKAAQEFSSRAASIKRQLRLQQMRSLCAAQVEHAQSIALVKKLQRCLDIRKAYGEQFADLLGDLPEFDMERLLRAARDDAFTTSARKPCLTGTVTSDSSSLLDSWSQLNVKVLDGHRRPHHRLMLPTLLPAQPSSMSLSGHEIHDWEGVSLTDLNAVFGDRLPSITRTTLRELNLESFVTNSQLRHDMLFDSNLEFRPNDDGERGAQKKCRTDAFWLDIQHDLQAQDFRRIPCLIHEIKEIMMDLVATDEYRQSVEFNLDIALIAQQLQHGVFDAVQLMKYVCNILKAHCAPARDGMVGEMLVRCESGDFASSLRLTFETLERMKLDVANDQLRRLRPYVIENAVQYEWELFKKELSESSVTLKHTMRWLKPYAVHGSGTMDERISLAYMDLIMLLGNHSIECPETLWMDQSRLRSFLNEIHDLTITSCLMTIYRSIIHGRVTENRMAEMKQNLEILLADSSTTMAHIALHLSKSAAMCWNRTASDQDRDTLLSMIDRVLTPDNAVYVRIQDLIKGQILLYLKTRQIANAEALLRLGLVEVGPELMALGERIRAVVDHNRQVYAKIYQQILMRSYCNHSPNHSQSCRKNDIK